MDMLSSILKLNIIFFLLLAFVTNPAIAQFNHPELHWRVLETPHFLVHYHQKEEVFAQKVANAAEEVYPTITSDLGYEPKEKTFIIIKNYDDTTGGYTSTLTGKIFIQAQSDPTFTSGDLSWAREVIAHEFTHLVTFAAIEESLFPLRRGMANLILPMWFLEGLAEYEGERWHSLKEMVVSDEARENKVMSEGELGAFYFFEEWGRISGYYQSESFVRYIINTYGKDRIARILTCLRTQPLFQLVGEISLTTGEMSLYPLPRFISFDKALLDAIGKDSSTLYAEWRSWITDKYKEEKAFQDSLFTPERLLTSQGRKNRHPVFSPSGDKVAFASNRGYEYSLFDHYLMDLTSGRERRLDRQINPFICFSPDGKKIIYSKTSFHPTKRAFLSDLYSVDIKSGRRKRLTSGLRASEPSISPDGEKIVFVRKEGGNSNLFLLDLRKGEISPLTEDHDGLTQNFSPSFSPDGKMVAFASFRKGQRDIYLLRLQDRSIFPLTFDQADDRCPVFSPTGREVYFISDREKGAFNLYSIDLKTAQMKRYTKVSGGVFEPSISPDGEKLLISVYKGGRFSLYLLPFKDLEGKIVSPKAREKRKLIAEYGQEERISYPSLSYRPRLKVHYILPWFSLKDDSSYFSLQSYASDVLEKHSLSFYAFFGKEAQYELFYVNRSFEPTIWLDLYSSPKLNGQEIGISYPLNDKNAVGVSFATRDDASSFSQPLRVSTLRAVWQYADMVPTCDSDLNPRGMRTSLRTEYSGRDIGSELEYILYSGEFRGYKYLGKKNNLALRILAGRVENREGTAEELRLCLGGVNTLRGYPEEYVEGENFLLSSLEYRFLLAKRIGGSPSLYIDRLAGALFFDMGDAWMKKKEMDPKRDWGLEFRLKILPFCKYSLVFRLGIVWPLDYGDRSARIFFTIGNVF